MDTQPDALKAAIRDEAFALGFDLVRFTTAAPFPDTARVLHERIDAGLFDGLPWFGHDRADVAADPANLMPEVRSIVSLGISYLTHGEPDATEPGVPHGRVARYAWGQDYHDVFRQRLRALHGFVERQLGRPVGSRALSDTARITDRAVAARAGLGWYGKNANLLTHDFGSWVLLGELLLDVDLLPDQPIRTHCGSCARCMPACPTGAIIAPGVVDNDRCISYLTIELRGPMPRELRPLVGNWIFGCDICQEACPVNAHRDPPDHAEFRPRPEVGSSPALIPLLALTPDEFRDRFRDSPIRRAKWAGLRRNVCVALGNLRDPASVPALAAVLGEDHALVRGHAAWALGRIGGDDARAALHARLAVEEDAWVREEIGLALGEQGA
ncbi:MAG: tRNA epoxyqueuosine(34) reductase QueG [Chloroflexia bacterium]